MDDEPQLVELMRRYLERLGYEIVTAGDTGEAWSLVEGGPAFRTAIIDLTVPGRAGEPLTGEELARRVLAADASARVILASGYAADVSPIQAAFPGRVRFLQKPFSGEMLAETLAALGG